MLKGGEGRECAYEAQDDIPLGTFLAPDFLDQTSMYPKRLELKVGAQVMLLKNVSDKFVNGSRGVVIAFTDGGGDEGLVPVVKFLCGGTMVVRRENDAKETTGNRKATRRQIPLRLSWAITIH